jgi:hypothetical protein
MKNVAGFKIVWTSNLLDHLLVLDADEKVKVHIPISSGQVATASPRIIQVGYQFPKATSARISNPFPAL